MVSGALKVKVLDVCVVEKRGLLRSRPRSTFLQFEASFFVKQIPVRKFDGKDSKELADSLRLEFFEGMIPRVDVSLIDGSSLRLLGTCSVDFSSIAAHPGVAKDATIVLKRPLKALKGEKTHSAPASPTLSALNVLDGVTPPLSLSEIDRPVKEKNVTARIRLELCFENKSAKDYSKKSTCLDDEVISVPLVTSSLPYHKPPLTRASTFCFGYSNFNSIVQVNSDRVDYVIPSSAV
mmetsp:Transcript_30913/g.50013  ORF Transcript_30913/g.50013 Transcript_30913/m.50013 type:complete len:236 (+) Transcript_30913:320-1027(+)|eukprot:CAMPEP_0184651624 /NCGR_PEP_ID=MMETSP0308-20130426/9262_1 /TAXON_ID=38269 /ORGANISM="Gloeochaete witrockiana, Strain SAG 46.84" /LENGTH=235 /DNA_ID=CAMNT_0027085981 /DNA_START=237 /DNA_END=944 /DNA_ORIENTATION=-